MVFDRHPTFDPPSHHVGCNLARFYKFANYRHFFTIIKIFKETQSNFKKKLLQIISNNQICMVSYQPIKPIEEYTKFATLENFSLIFLLRSHNICFPSFGDLIQLYQQYLSVVQLVFKNELKIRQPTYHFLCIILLQGHN